MIFFEGKKILVVQKDIEKNIGALHEKLNVDFVVISGSPKIYLQDLKNVADFKQIIFDSSNKMWRVKKWSSWH